MQYTLNDKKRELKQDIFNFQRELKKTNDKTKKKMYSSLINDTKTELEYVIEIIEAKGIDYENYDYDL
jgi:hypothetical protein